MNATVCMHLCVTGRVQGVGFRYTMQRQAARLGLAGWVRNRRDGSVEAVASGPAAAVDALIEWAHQGPSAAQVAAVDATPWDGEVPEGDFRQMPTV